MESQIFEGLTGIVEEINPTGHYKVRYDLLKDMKKQRQSLQDFHYWYLHNLEVIEHKEIKYKII